MLSRSILRALLFVGALSLTTSVTLAGGNERPEAEQQEEVFSQSIQKLTGRAAKNPVYSHIYGAEFMTEKERCEYLLKLDGMKTKSERDAFRAQHRKAIDERRKKIGG
ncbi:hypothetical protein Nhal_1574 [Nitrosococcus halophilus Nc 4]|uniref:Secreted protein n=1 Tax=Nitrosococcus halophilus (strain Nc4) TaxID=472759 RepID=D5C1S8_NITHN|nr:hypothetical protein [Nitrosococcus halophilus]ADE14711.1 hypothetical protein Nhal_1574 [Nitrosococcus halophilus Nc 4]